MKSLGAVDPRGSITALGKKMAALPMHPRLSAMLVGSVATGQGALACTLAAILSERDLLPRGSGTVSDSDLLDRLDALAERRDPQASRTVERLATYFRNALGVEGTGGHGDASAVGELLLMAYPDRVARERSPGSGRYLMAKGSGARLSRRSNLRSQPFIVAVEVEGGGAEGEIHMASAVTLEAVRTGCAGAVARERRVFWDEREGRVVAREEERLGAVVLSERVVTPEKGEIGQALLGGVLSGPGLSGLNWNDEARQLQNRVNFLRRVLPEEGLPDLSDRALAESLDRWLLPYLDGVRSLAHLARVDLREPLKGMLEWRQQRLVDDEAPTHLKVPSGSRIALEYPAEGDPFLAVKLQEMFGLAETPRVARGRVPVVIHLLSPARRPIQVTSDLKSFWNGAYREVCKELKGRYPKHPWPDDPWNAPATRHVKKRM